LATIGHSNLRKSACEFNRESFTTVSKSLAAKYLSEVPLCSSTDVFAVMRRQRALILCFSATWAIGAASTAHTYFPPRNNLTSSQADTTAIILSKSDAKESQGPDQAGKHQKDIPAARRPVGPGKQAQDPKNAMHTAAITKIAVDAANRYLVTGSEDKTVRIWDIKSWQLLKTIRPPIGEGQQGEIYAVAMTPDGKTIAAAGYTGHRKDEAQGALVDDVYIYDRQSGQLLRTLSVPFVVDNLLYSKDGELLVATSLNRFDHTPGFVTSKIFTTSDYQSANYRHAGGVATWADTDRQGRLFFIEKYGTWVAEITDRKSSGRGESRSLPDSPSSVSFSPDGSMIAIGSINSVRVYSGADLSLLFTPDAKGIGQEDMEFSDVDNVSSVAWSSDGRFLYYSGARTCINDTCYIRKWEDAGRGSYKDIPAAHSRITHLLPLENGSIIYASIDPAIGIIDAQDKRTRYRENRAKNPSPKKEAAPPAKELVGGCFVATHWDNMQLEYEKGKWGYINKGGDIVVPPQFKFGALFSEGLATADKDNQFGFIDKNGKMVIRPQFSPPVGQFSEGLAIVAIGDKYGYIDKTGHIAIAPAFLTAYPFSDGLALVEVPRKSGYGYIDKSGQIIIHPRFAAAHPFSEGLAAVENHGMWGYIDRTGNMVIEPQFESAQSFSEGLAEVRLPGGAQGYIDKTGKIVIKATSFSLWYSAFFSNGRAMVFDRRHDTFGFINQSGTFVIEPKLRQAQPFSEGLAAVKIGDQWGYVDKEAALVIQPEFEYAFPFSEGIALIQKEGMWGYIDKTGKIIIRPQFRDAKRFSEGLAAACFTESSLQSSFTPPSGKASAQDITERRESQTEATVTPEQKAVGMLPTAQSDSQQKEVAALHERVAQLYGAGKYMEALPLAQQAVDLVWTAVGQDNPAMVQPLTDRAHLYYAIGQYKRIGGQSALTTEEFRKAKSLHERAAGIQEKAFEPHDPVLAQSLEDLSMVASATSRWDEAIDLAQRVLTIRKTQLGSQHVDVARSASNLAALKVMKLNSQHQYIKAVPVAQKALAEAEQALGPEDASFAQILSSLSESYKSLKLGAAEYALKLQQQALTIREQSLGPKHWDVLASLNNIAQLHVERGEYTKAEPLYQRVLAAEEEILAADNHAIAPLLDKLAAVQRLMGRYVKAEKLYQRIVAMQDKGEDSNTDLASALEKFADMSMALQEYAKAEPLYQRALSIWERRREPNIFSATILSKLGTLNRITGQYAQAETLYQRALKIYEKSPFRTSWALRDLAALAAAQQNYDSAAAFLKKSLDTFEDDFKSISRFGGAAEQLRSAQSAYVSGSYFFFLALVSEHLSSQREAVHYAYELVLRNKGIIFDSAAQSREVVQGSLAKVLKKSEEMSVLRSTLSHMILHVPTDLSPEEYGNKLALVYEQYKQRESEEYLNDLLSGPSASSPQLLATVEQLSRNLPKNAAVVEFVKIPAFDYAHKDFTFANGKWLTPWRYVAFVVTGDGNIAVLNIGDASSVETQLQQTLKDIRVSMTVRDPADESAVQNSLQGLRQLYVQLWRPLKSALGSVDKVFISPDGLLNLFPFAALVDDEGHPLVDVYRIAYLSSGRDLARGKVTPIPSKSSLLLFANPAFGDDSAGSRAPGGAHRSRDFQHQFSLLWGTEREAVEIPPLIAGPEDQKRVLRGALATESAVKGAHSPRILHLATHGFFLPDDELEESGFIGTYENPLVRSGLAFAGANTAAKKTDGDDGVLTALEVSGMDLAGTELVVLSACDTGTGEVQTGQGVLGLRSAFVVAGARNLLMSLWPVNDEMTAFQMKAFYRNLPSMPPAEALRQAQLQTIRKLKAEHDGNILPGLWAPFILQGSDGLGP
jgi:CHAT domain-containing protein/tetratricopeptide (TPR) repeat protein/WD40 repeat protein